ncbi:Potassium voltage-gated channel sub H member 7 [Chytriomyces hyalinus]|nr:Potassium voltage-gated channel sub H member 7 [Chytriomyces hyalinus]
MNTDELNQITADFRRLRTEMIERADQILSLFDSALKRTSVVRTSSERINYLDLGIRITEGDYVVSNQSTKPSSYNSLFAEEEKKPAARSLVVSQQTDLNSWGFPSMSRSKSKKEGAAHPGQAGSSTRALETSLTPRPESPDAPNLSTAPPHPQKLLANESPKNLMINVLSALKPHLSMVTEANSAQASFSSIEPTMVALSPELGVAKVFPSPSIRRESITESAKSQPTTQDKETRRISTEFKYMPRFMPFYSSSLRANGSQHSSANSSSDSGFSFTNPPQSESAPQKPGPRITSRTRESILKGPPPLPFSGSGDLQKTVTQHTLLISSDNQAVKRALTSKKLQGPPPNSLAAFGSLHPEFHVNGIHSRLLFSNIWDLALGFVMFVLFWLIPFVAAYNPIYDFCNVNVLSISISLILLCDSAVALMTPQLLRGESSFDVGEYEKARSVLPVWLSHWLRSKFAINLVTIIPFSIFFKSHMHNEFLLFISLIRGFKLWSHFCRSPTIVNFAWRVDDLDLAGTSVSRIIPLTIGIFWFIHCNSCTIFMMGRMTGFVGWSAMWPLLDSATLFETYIWTFYKAVGNMFPTSFNPWTASEQIASMVYITFAAVVYAVFLGAISSAVMAVNPSGRLFDQKVGELRDYIRSKDLSKETEARLLTYYETRYRGKYFEEDALLSDLNDSLKAEILLQNTRKLIMNVPFLKRSVGDGRDELFMGRIAGALHSINFIPGDYVTKQGDSGSDMYFILNGKAEVYVGDRLTVTLGAGAYFGEFGLITKTLRTATVLAILPSLM